MGSRQGEDRRGNLRHGLLVGFAFVALVACGWQPEGLCQSKEMRAAGIAPDFSRMDLDRHRVRLSDYRGRVVLLNFWATWCGPCLEEMPRFLQWQREMGGEGLQVLGVSMDDDESPVRKTVSRLRLNYPVLMGDEKLGEAYHGVLGLPVTILIDRTGKMRYRHQGGEDWKAMQAEVRSLLAEPVPAKH